MQKHDEEGKEIFSVEFAQDDVYQSGQVVESFAYQDEDGIKEVYLTGLDEVKAELTYSERDFGHAISENSSQKISLDKAEDPNEILREFEDDRADFYNEEISSLTGSNMSACYQN